MEFVGYIVTGFLAFVFGVLVTQLACRIKKNKQENAKDE